MSDTLSSAERSAVMALIRCRGNRSTERRLVDIMKIHGISGWRRNVKAFGTPDFVFPRQRVAVFVDGCFWHGCPNHCRLPSTNRIYWESKVSRNLIRDRAVNRHLRAKGWKVVRIWEHALRSPRRTISRLVAALRSTELHAQD